MLKFVFAALLLVSVASGQTLQSGPCPNVKVVQDFDVPKYFGLWYQISRYPNPFEQGNCSTALYGPVDENGLVAVHNAEIRHGNESTIDGTAELADSNSTEAKLIVRFHDPESVADYWVLGTDYDNYSLVYSCREFSGGLFHVQFSWVLGREKPLPDDITAIVSDLIVENGINPDYYKVHEEEACLTEP